MYLRISDNELIKLIRDANNNDIQAQDKIFEQLCHKSIAAISEGRHHEGFLRIKKLLHKIEQLDEPAYSLIHKGTPYYWMGCVAYLTQDYENATFFFDAALSEDIRAGRTPYDNPPFPPFLFMSLDGENVNQAGQQLTRDAASRIEAVIDFYNRLAVAESLPTTSKAELQKKFLRPAIDKNHIHWRSMSTSFISFMLEWNYRDELFNIRPGEGTLEPFFLHLFKGCLIFESLLELNPTLNPKTVFSGKSYLTLKDKLKAVLTNLSIARIPDIGSRTFAVVLSELSTEPESIENMVAFTGRVRNVLGHSLDSTTQLTKISYQKLTMLIGAACIHAIKNLY